MNYSECKKIDKQFLQLLIDNETQENLTLDYKACDALRKTDGKKAEISKDVSAMANSAGGRIIYGISEYNSPSKKHLPEKFYPIDLGQYSKEWLEQVISSNVAPRISGITITPISIDKSTAIFVVDIPQSDKGHQAKDKRYYKRYNFESVPMEDYELKDILNRNVHPEFEVDIQFNLSETVVIDIEVTNVSSVIARYVSLQIFMPIETQREPEGDEILIPQDLHKIEEKTYLREIHRNIEKEWQGPKLYVPILPGLSHKWRSHLEHDGLCFVDLKYLHWKLSADNAPVRKGNKILPYFEVDDDDEKIMTLMFR